MNINELLCGFECDCGKRHECKIKKVYIDDEAIDKLSEICADFGKILLVGDENTWRAAGDLTVGALEGKDIRRVIFPAVPLLIPNEEATRVVEDNLAGADLIVGIGSGVVQDLCKYVSHRNGVPYVIVATAPSMDGYASSGAAMILGGMKETVPAGLPLAIVAQVSVLKDAPLEMIKAGYGDIVGKYSALSDWKLGKAVLGEYFCEWIYNLTLSVTKSVVPLAKSLLNRDSESIKLLMEALITVGIAMSFAGNSRPASGGEHHLSHFFEITGIVKSERYLPHGIDVLYSTLITAKIREKLTGAPFPRLAYQTNENEYRAEMLRVFDKVADGCISLQKKIGAYGRELLPIYLEKEAEIAAVLSDMPSSKEIEELILNIELNPSELYTVYGKEKLCDAIKYAKDLKDRYTVLWLYYDLFGKESVI